MDSSVKECPVCNEFYDRADRKPMILACGHSFCRNCISSILINWSMSCPICRRSWKHIEVNDIPVCYQLLPDEFGLIQREESSLTCSKHASSVIFWCESCEEIICQDCVDENHSGCILITTKNALLRIRDTGVTNSEAIREEIIRNREKLHKLSRENKQKICIVKGFRELVDKLLISYEDHQIDIDSVAADILREEETIIQPTLEVDNLPLDTVIAHFFQRQRAIKNVRELNLPQQLPPSPRYNHILNYKEPGEQTKCGLIGMGLSLGDSAAVHLARGWQAIQEAYRSIRVRDGVPVPTAPWIQQNSSPAQGSSNNIGDGNVWMIHDDASAGTALLALQVYSSNAPEAIIVEVTNRWKEPSLKLVQLLPVIAATDCDVRLRFLDSFYGQNQESRLPLLNAFFGDGISHRCRLVEYFDSKRHYNEAKILNFGRGRLKSLGISGLPSSFSDDIPSAVSLHVSLRTIADKEVFWSWPSECRDRHLHYQLAELDSGSLERFIEDTHPWASKIDDFNLVDCLTASNEDERVDRWTLHLPLIGFDEGSCQQLLGMLRHFKVSHRPCLVYLQLSHTLDFESKWLLYKRFFSANIELNFGSWFDLN